jgi:hypothetical protein
MILLTAFEPFGEEPDGSARSVNVSKEALHAIRSEFGDQLGYLVMTVDDACTEQLDAKLDERAWDGVILLGEAGGPIPARIERRATDPADPSARSTRQARAATTALGHLTGLPLTDQIGRYYCNTIYHHALGRVNRAVFVHLSKEHDHALHVDAVRRLVNAWR